MSELVPQFRSVDMEAQTASPVITPVKINVNMKEHGLSVPLSQAMGSPPPNMYTSASPDPDSQAQAMISSVGRDGQGMESPPAPMESPVSDGQVPVSFPHPTSPHQEMIMRSIPMPTSPQQEALMRTPTSPDHDGMLRMPMSPTEEDLMRIQHGDPTSPDGMIRKNEFSPGVQGVPGQQVMYTRAPTPRKSTHIEVIPCKICGDKSSGVHYGVITCEGCKGFFRRSQAGPVNYQCPRNKNCVIDRVNRNRCQYCRLQKCLQLGMSRDAVKFGRMSKKQREKVEDEANFHKRNRMNGITDPLPYPDTPTTNNNQYPGSYPAPHYQYSPNGYGTYPTYSQIQVPEGSYAIQTTTEVAHDEIDLGLLTKAIADAHARTCLFTNDQIEKMRGMTVSQDMVEMYRNMTHEKLWVEIAEKVTMTVQQIIEFSKMVPGFMNLLQDDQIMLLKGGSFEIALLRLCRAFDIPTNSVIFGNAFVPLEAFSSLNEEESMVMVQIFEFAKDMIALNLTENELALLCAVVLIDSNRPGVRDSSVVEKLSERIEAALKMEVGLAHPDDDLFKTKLIERIPKLRELSSKHVEILNRFKQSNPGVDFPALHKELFSTDGSA